MERVYASATLDFPAISSSSSNGMVILEVGKVGKNKRQQLPVGIRLHEAFAPLILFLLFYPLLCCSLEPLEILRVLCFLMIM